MAVVAPFKLAPGVTFWRDYFTRQQQQELVAAVVRLARLAPFFRPLMPKTGKPFSVEQTNFGVLGWMSDQDGYRYVSLHPATGNPWPAIPEQLLQLWEQVSFYPHAPQCCLVNHYRAGAKMGLHQDRDEEELEAPVVSVSLGDAALFRFGSAARKGPTQSVNLSSGDVLTFGGPARRMFHGIDRIIASNSSMVPDGGRINLTMRRVTKPKS